jgi:DNA-binding transcriptional LysR family regulator
MTPTPRAEQLARPVRRALDELQLALEPDVFSPATAERIFVVALNNFGAIALAAPVVSECLKQAPRIRVSLRPSGTLDLLNFLERAELDLVISALDAPADRFAARTLVVDHYVVVMRRGHPAAKLTMDIEGLPSCRASSCPPREACEPSRGHRLERRSRSSFVVVTAGDDKNCILIIP